MIMIKNKNDSNNNSNNSNNSNNYNDNNIQWTKPTFRRALQKLKENFETF